MGFYFLLVTIRILFQIASYVTSYIICSVSGERALLSYFGRTCEENVLAGEAWILLVYCIIIYHIFVVKSQIGNWTFLDVEELPHSKSVFLIFERFRIYFISSHSQILSHCFNHLNTHLTRGFMCIFKMSPLGITCIEFCSLI